MTTTNLQAERRPKVSRVRTTLAFIGQLVGLASLLFTLGAWLLVVA